MSEQKTLNPWDYKPWWCQPWSILFTGVTLIIGSWLLLKIIWVTLIVAIPVLVWMGFFLLIWPQLMIRSGVLESYQNDANTFNQTDKL
jgi:ABC-type transport system involved in cytochrome c biogenesis permease subunit